MNFRLLIILLFLLGSNFSFALSNEDVKDDIRIIRKLWFNGDLDKGFKLSQKALKNAKKLKNDTLTALIYNEIGIIYDYKGDYAESIDNYFKALKIFQKLNDQENLAYVYSNIGLIYYSSSDFDLSLKYQYKSLYIRKKIKDINGQSSCYNNIAIVYMSQGKYDKAIHYYSVSLKIDRETNNKIGVADSYNNIGICYMDLKDYDKAIDYFTKAIKISKKLNFSNNLQNATSNLGTVYRKQKKFQLAKNQINESLKISLKSGDKKNTAYCYNILTQIAEEEKDYKNAFFYSEKYYSIEKKRIGESNLRQLASLEVKHKYEKEKDIEKAKLMRSQAENKTNAILLISACIVLLFALIMSVFLYSRWKQAQEQKRIISHSNSLLHEQNIEIMQSINYAQRIQNALLPAPEKIDAIFPKNSLIYLPRDIISGDFYWTFETENHKYIAVADCTGHGVPGALMNMICHNALNRSIVEFNCKLPSEILHKTREIIVAELSKKDGDVSDGMDISFLSINKLTHELIWSGAHNDLWIIRKENNELETIKALNQPIGKHITYSEFKNHIICVSEGDRLVLLTDGYGDQFGGPKNKKFKDSNLKKILIQKNKESIHSITAYLAELFKDWKKDEPQIDDVCLLIVEI